MARPKPVTILEYINKTTYKSTKILAADGIYAVFYDGKPMNGKTEVVLVSLPGPKYFKSSFSNRGHAINLAKKLNTLFKTDKFSVMLMVEGVTVFP
jgi:hypothetical protein